MRHLVVSTALALAVPVFASSLVGCITSSTSDAPDAAPAQGFDSGGGDTGAGDSGTVPGTDAGDAGTDAPATSSCVAPTGKGTTHIAPIAADETWKAADNPHVIGTSISVAAAATLTIEPCAVVLIQGSASVVVNGKLSALGTALNPIRIEAQDPAKPFSAIQTTGGTSSIELSSVTIKSGGDAADVFHAAPLYIRGDGTTLKPYLKVQNVTIDGSAQYGIVLTGLAQITPDSSGLTIKNTALRPVRATAPAAGSIPSGSFTANGIDELLIVADAPIAADMTLEDRGVPYRLGDTTANASGDLRIGHTAPASGGTDDKAVLTLEAGVVVRVDAAGRIATALASTATDPSIGTIVANGTATKPVVFTSAAASPAPGDWVGLYFAGPPAPGNKLDFVKVEFAGGPSGAKSFHCQPDPVNAPQEAEDSAILILDGPPGASFVTNSTITSSKGYGIDRGWRGTTVDFAATNTFIANAKCNQSVPRNADGSCPNPTLCQ